jgi:uncharacterized protein YwqG
VNALWNQWRKQLSYASVPSRSMTMTQLGLSPLLLAQLRGVLTPVARHCVGISLGGAATRPTESFLSGHPYLPPGVGWPEGIDGPQLFVGQLNFADFAAPAGFPRSGLLQWFVGADSSWGLDSASAFGAAGFTVRWYADPVEVGSPPPDSPTPNDAYDELPMEFVGPTLLDFGSAISTPGWDELPAEIRDNSVWAQLALALGEPDCDPGFLYEEYLRGSNGPLHDHRAGSKIGGYPSFATADPRGSGAYPSPDTGHSELIIELDSLDVGGWRDCGIAHLFGDPTSIAAGDLSSVRYHWDCL